MACVFFLIKRFAIVTGLLPTAPDFVCECGTMISGSLVSDGLGCIVNRFEILRVLMKLYIYDHCPFCVRCRMIFGLRDVAVEEVVLANDDETTPIGMIGSKTSYRFCKRRRFVYGREFGYCPLHRSRPSERRSSSRSTGLVGQNWVNTITNWYSRLWSKLVCPNLRPMKRKILYRQKEKSIGNFRD